MDRCICPAIVSKILFKKWDLLMLIIHGKNAPVYTKSISRSKYPDIGHIQLMVDNKCERQHLQGWSLVVY